MSPFVLALSGPPGAGLDLNPWVGLSLAVFLVLLNGFFVAAEFALVKVRPTQIEPYAARGNRRGKVASHMIDHLDAYLSATQLGITLASLALGWIGEPAFAWMLEPVLTRLPNASPALIHSISLTAAFLVITVLHIVLGELAPKSVAIRKPTATSLWVAIPLFAFYKLTYPAIWILNLAANTILKLIKIEPLSEGASGHDENELRLLLASTHAGVLSQQKKQILDRVLTLSHRTTRKIMVPRADIVFLSTAEPLETSLARARKSGHTRFPLCDGDLDHIVGLIHIKDLFQAQPFPKNLQDVRREIAFVPETLSLDRLLRRMLNERVHLAAVLDEYGGTSGIVSLENVIEEIVGEIQDEFDWELPELAQLSPNVFVAAGSLLVDDLEHALKLEFSTRDEDTIAGVVLSELGRKAKIGDQVEIGPLQAEVLEVEGNRITKVRLTTPPPEPPVE